MTANCSLNKNLFWQFTYLFIIYIYTSNSGPVGFPAHHLMLSTGEVCSGLWLAWLPYPGATIETHSLPSHLIPVKMRSALLQNTVASHNSHTPNSHTHSNSHTYPNGHTYPISHTLFALSKMWLFGYVKNFGKKYIFVFKKNNYAYRIKSIKSSKQWSDGFIERTFLG